MARYSRCQREKVNGSDAFVSDMKIGLRFAAVTLYKNFVSDTSVLGGLPFYAIIAAYFAFTNAILAFKMLYALAALFIVVYSLKLLYFKKRPDVRKSRFPSLLERLENSSFPSVHAGRAGLLYMAFFYGHAPVLSLMGLALAATVAASRVALKRHYPSDVAAGAVLGFIIGYFALVV